MIKTLAILLTLTSAALAQDVEISRHSGILSHEAHESPIVGTQSLADTITDLGLQRARDAGTTSSLVCPSGWTAECSASGCVCLPSF